MYIPSDPKVIEAMLSDRFVRRWIFWFPLIVGGLLFYMFSEGLVLPQEIVNSFVWLPVAIFPSIDVWGERSRFHEATRVLFSFFAYAAIYYAVLVARWSEYEKAFVGSCDSFKRHFRPLVVILYIFPSWLLLNIALPVEEKCFSLCIYESRVIQVIYMFMLSVWFGFGLASLYWWIRNFSKIHL